MTTLNVYGDYIAEAEGGKATPLARPTTARPSPEETPTPVTNVIDLASRRRSAV